MSHIEIQFITNHWWKLHCLLSQRNHLINSIMWIKAYSNIPLKWEEYIHIAEDNSYTVTFLQNMKEHISLHQDEKERKKGISLLLSSLPDSVITDVLLQAWGDLINDKHIHERVRRLYIHILKR